LVTLGIADIVMRQRVLPATDQKLFDISALCEAPFMLCTAGCFFGGFMVLYVPFLNSGSILGCVFPNVPSYRIGTLNTLIPCTLARGVIALYMSVDETGGLLVFATRNLDGLFFSGSFVSLRFEGIIFLNQM
jgi:hypothetical protein